MNSRDLKKRIAVFVAMLIACIGHSYAAVNDGAALTNISVGLQSLTLQTRAGLVSADRAFALALTNNPTNSMALTLKSVTGLAILQENPEFIQLLTHIGVIQPQQSIYHLDYKTPTDQYGSAVVSGTMSNVISYIDTTLRPQISNSISQLSRVSTNVSFTLTGQQTGTLPVAVDYGDVQLALSALYLAEAISYTGDRYNFGITLNDVSKALSGEITIEEILVKYPLLLGYGSNNGRVEAKQALINANAAFQRAVAFIPNQRVPRPGYPNVFSIDKDDPKAMEGLVSMGRRFNALAASFVSPQVFPADATSPTLLDGKTINMGIWASTQTPPRSWLGTNSFWGDLYNPGTLTDPTFSGILPDMTQELWSGYMQQQNRLRFIAEGALLESDGAFLKGPQPSWDPLLTEGNILAGTYVTSTHGISGNPTGYGFLYDGSHYTAIEYPMAQFTRISGMADGKIWGSYNKGSLSGAFIYSNGAFTDIRYPGALDTWINWNNGVVGDTVTGNYWSGNWSNGEQKAFTYDGTSYTSISFPGASNTWINGKSGNLIWGTYQDSNWQQHGFLFDGTNYTSIAYPGATYTSIYGGVGGKIWGYYNRNDNNYSYGYFLYENGNYTEFKHPQAISNWGPNSTWIEWSNAANNKATGSYSDNTGTHGFIYDGSGFTTIDYPGAYVTTINGYFGNKYCGSFSANSGIGFFLYENGQFSTINIPGGNIFRGGRISAISGNNVIGSYWNGSEQKAFVFNGSTFSTISYPGANNNYLNEVGSKWVTGNYSGYSDISGWVGGSFAYPLASLVPDPVTTPVIMLIGSNPASAYKGSAFTDPGAAVVDNAMTNVIIGAGVVDTSTLGSYTLTYGYTNAAGLAATPVTRTVNVTLDPNGDEDGDGLNNFQETIAGTNLYNKDSDGDGISDYREIQDSSDPLNAASQNTLSKGLVAYYPLNGNAMDQSGNGYNGINVGGTPTTDRLGNSNSAFAFSGTANGINQSKPNSPTVYDSFTISFWFKAQTADQLAAEQSWTTDYWYYGHYTIPGNNYIPGFCGIGIHAGTNGISVFEHGAQILTPILVYPKNFGADWNHAVISVQNDGAPILYINGTKARTGLNTGNLKLISPLHSGDLGYGIEQGLAGRYKGSLNDVRLYDRALSSSEVGQLYATEAGDLDSDGDGLSDAYEQGQGRYEVISGNFTWEQAKADAESRTNAYGIKGHLATIANDAEWETIQNQLGSSLQVKDWWIGGTDINHEGDWRWVTGETWSYSRWHSSEPSNGNGIEHYLTIDSRYGQLALNDVEMTNEGQVGYVLEYGYPSDPNRADSDGDGFNDLTEQLAGTDPNDGTKHPKSVTGLVTTDTFGSGNNQFSIDFVTVGNPGNSNDATGYGGVPYVYRIGKYAISQNQIDAATANGMQNVIAGAWSGDKPAANISWFEAAAYVNWLNTSQGFQPSYNLTWDGSSWSMSLWTPSDAGYDVGNPYRNIRAKYFLPSENEWYKAAYYDPNKNSGSGGYWLYPTGSDNSPICVVSGTNAGTAIFVQDWSQGPASISQAGGLSPYGTMGQGGNVWQLMESSWSQPNQNPLGERVIRGGGGAYNYDGSPSIARYYHDPYTQRDNFGYRIASRDVAGGWNPPNAPVVSADNDLYVGSNTPNNSLVLGSGTSTYRNTFVGYQSGSSNNQLLIGGGSTQSLTNGLIAYYSFDGNGNDLSGNGRNLTLTNSSYQTGLAGQALFVSDFLGGAYYTNASGPRGTELTFSAWINPSQLAQNPKEWMYLISGRDTDSVLLRLGVGSNYPSQYLTLNFGYGSPSDVGYSYSTPAVTTMQTNAWQHIVATASGSEYCVYVNGVQVGRVTNAVTIPFDANNYILGNSDLVGSGYRLNGMMDEVRIYNRALSSNEVAQLYQDSASLGNGLIAHYPLQGNGYDLSGNGNNAAVYNATPTTDRFGNSNGALFFNGTNSYLEASHQPYLNALPITISCWFSRHDTNSKGTLVGRYVNQSWNGYNLSYGDLSGTNSVIPLYASSYGNDISDGYDSTGDNPLYYSKPINDTNWHLATMTVNTNGSVLYIDGVADTNHAWRGAPLVTTATTPLLIGAEFNPDGQTVGDWSLFHGSISDVRIYNRSLASNEVAGLYDQAADGNQVTTDTFGSGSNQFTIDFVTIGNPGNSNDTTGYGGVPYSYRIGKYTISQNQIDAAAANGLQNVIAGAWSGDQPAANISWYEAAAYVNWLNTSQGFHPSYNLTWDGSSWSMSLWTPSDAGYDASNPYRNSLAKYFLPSENEFYKAAYGKRGGTGYYQYATASDDAPTAVGSGTASGTAVYNQSYEQGPASVYAAGGLSSYGTMGQGGNVYGWQESAYSGVNDVAAGDRGLLGGSWNDTAISMLKSSGRGYYTFPNFNYFAFGFRVASRDDMSGTNTVNNITGNGRAVLINTNNTYVGYDGSGNSLLVTNGALLQDVRGYIGTTTNSSNNFAIVTGTNSAWINTDNLYIGNDGSGNRLVISNGGTASNLAGYIGANFGASNSTVVTDAGSTWSNTFLAVGAYSSGNSLTVTNGGMVVTSQLDAGWQQSASGNSVLVSGTNSSIVINSSIPSDGIVIGSSGSGNSMTISNGAQVLNSKNGGIGSMASASNNSVLVTGVAPTAVLWPSSVTGTVITDQNSNVIAQYGPYTNYSATWAASTWSNNGILAVGAAGSGNTMTIEGGGQLFSGSGVIGGYSNSNSVNVSDVVISQTNFYQPPTPIAGAPLMSIGRWQTISQTNSSTWSNAGSLTIGDTGSANLLKVSNGGSVYSSGGVIGNAAVATGNAVIVSGAQLYTNYNGQIYPTFYTPVGAIPSSWNNSGELIVGNAGSSNSLSISSGGMVNSSSGIIGNAVSASNNSVTIQGGVKYSNSFNLYPGSSTTIPSGWSNSGNLTVGHAGSGNSLSVSSGGVVTSSNGIVGSQATSSNNSVTIDGAQAVNNVNVPIYAVPFGGGATLQATNQLVISESDLGLISNFAPIYNSTRVIGGTPSTWNNSGTITVGAEGSGNSVAVTGGGTVSGGSLVIGDQSMALSNSISVSGALLNANNNDSQLSLLPNYSNYTLRSSLMNLNSNLTVGSGGSGNSLNIADGGLVTSASGTIGDQAVASGNAVTVTGIGVKSWGDPWWGQLHPGFTLNSGTPQSLLSIYNPGGSYGSLSAPSTWSNSGVLTVGNQGSSNSLTVSFGAVVSSQGGVIGSAAGASNNSANISDGNWNNSGDLMIGHGGASNALSISGGSVSGVNLSVGNQSSASSNMVSLNGGTLTAWGVLTVGNQGSGNSMSIAGQGSVSSASAVIGATVGSSNNYVVVTGSSLIGSGVTTNPLRLPYTITTNPPFTIQPLPIYPGTNNTILPFPGGSGILDLNTNNYYNGIGVITNGSQSYGTLTLTGNSVINFSGLTGSSSLTFSSIEGLTTSSLSIYNWSSADGDSLQLNQAAGGLSAGDLSNISFYSGEGTGFLGTGGFFSGTEIVPVTNAQVMTSGQPNLSSNVTSLPHINGTVILGPDIITNRSTWNAGSDLVVGDAGSGNNLSIADGGLVTSANGMIGKQEGASNNSVLVTGSNSSWVMSGDLLLGAGQAYSSTGSNSLIISNGGTVSAGSSLFGTAIGIGQTSGNLIQVSGSNSTFNSSNIYIGYNGNQNLLEILDGGVVNSGYGLIGYGGDRVTGNQAIISGSNSSWNNDGTVVGVAGNSSVMVISNAGTVNSAFGIIGQFASDTNLPDRGWGSSNSVIVTGDDSSWSNVGNLTVGDDGSVNSLVISNTGGVFNSNGVIGNSITSSNNSVLVTGSNSIWSNSGNLMVGKSGSNNVLSLTEGGNVTVGNNLVVGGLGEGTGSGALNLDTGGLMVVSGSFGVGIGGSGTATLSGSSTMTVGSLPVPPGGGSNFNNIGIGGYIDFDAPANSISGSGLLVVSNGATLLGNIGNFAIGGKEGSRASVIVTGSNSLIQITNSGVNGGHIDVGNYRGSGNLSVLDGGAFIGNSLTLVSSNGNSSQVLISGAASKITVPELYTPQSWTNWASGHVVLGTANDYNPSTGNNLLTISNGGSLTSALGVVGVGGGTNAVIITGNNSVWNNSGAVVLGSGDTNGGGYGGNGSIQILNGGTLYTGVTTNSGTSLDGMGSVIGGTSNSVGTVILNSTNNAAASSWYNTGTITLANYGSSTLTVANGANVSTTNLVIAAQTGSSATINYGRFGQNDTAGNIYASNTTFGAGSWIANFNQTDLVRSSVNLAGMGVVNQRGSGTSVLTGSNAAFAGPLNIFNGTLSIGDGNTAGGSAVTGNILNNSTLVINPGSGETYSLPGVISGSGTVVITGSGMPYNLGYTALSGSNSYTGGTLLQGAHVIIENNSAFGTGSLHHQADSGLIAGTNNLITTNAMSVDIGTVLAFGNNSNNWTISSPISGNGCLAFYGVGTTTLTSSNSITGPVTTFGGLLKVSGSLATNSAITLAVGSHLSVTGSVGNIEGQWASTLSGTGTVGNVTVSTGATITPGVDKLPGTLSLQSALWAPGGNYNWVLNDASGPAGTGYSSLNIASTLDLSQLSATNKFNINVSAGTNGMPLNFSGLVSTNWTIATFGGVTNFSASNFAINTVATNGASGWSGLTNGTLGISTNGNKLELTYTAKNSAPDWKTPTGKRYSAVIYAKVLDENGNQITAYGSKLAVFDGSDCAGVASPAGGPGGTKLYQLTVFANQSRVNGMTYQVYDASSGVTSTLDETYDFKSGVNAGTINNPIVLHIVTKQMIPIYDGWTWISFHLQPEDQTWASLLQRYEPSDNDVIIGTKGSVTYFGGEWYASSPEFKPEVGVMYMISSEKSATIEAVGSKTPLPTLNLVSGWNWVGCPRSSSTTLLAMMPTMQSSNDDVIISQSSQMGTYWDGVWYNTTGDDFPIVPGMGYLIYVATPQSVPLR